MHKLRRVAACARAGLDDGLEYKRAFGQLQAKAASGKDERKGLDVLSAAASSWL